MQKPHLLSVVFFGAMTALLFLSTPVSAQTSMQEVYNQAVVDFDAGKLDDAQKGFERVLKANPRYVYARKYLTQIQQKRKTGGNTAATIEPQVKQIVLDTVEFEGASLKDVMTYLSQKAEEQTGGAFVPNFVYRGTAEQAAVPVTLKLRNIPMTDVIKYVGQTTGTQFTYDKYSVVGVPTSKPQAAISGSQEDSGPAVTSTFD